MLRDIGVATLGAVMGLMLFTAAISLEATIAVRRITRDQ